MDRLKMFLNFAAREGKNKLEESEESLGLPSHFREIERNLGKYPSLLILVASAADELEKAPQDTLGARLQDAHSRLDFNVRTLFEADSENSLNQLRSLAKAAGYSVVEECAIKISPHSQILRETVRTWDILDSYEELNSRSLTLASLSLGACLALFSECMPSVAPKEPPLAEGEVCLLQKLPVAHRFRFIARHRSRDFTFKL